jgi:hypothetical protein
MRFTVFILIFFLGAYPLSGQSITATVSPDSLSPGDQLELTITATYQSGTFKALYPGENDFRDPFEFLSLHRFKDISNRDSIVYKLQFFGVKDTLLTSKRVLFITGQDTLSLDTAPIPVYFKSNLDENANELQPFKPIFDFARSWAYLIILVLLLTIVGFLMWYYRDRFFDRNPQVAKETEPNEIPVFVNPYSIFEKNITALKEIDEYAHDQYKQWHVDLSDIIRTYYETAHSIPALESTTREFAVCLKKSNFPEEIIQYIQAILKRCDLIKFAKVQADMHSCVLLLEQTEILKDLIRFNDETLLRRLKNEHEIRYGLRSIEQSTRSETTEPKTIA